MRDVIAPDLGSQISPNPSSDCSVKAALSVFGVKRYKFEYTSYGYALWCTSCGALL